MFTLILITLNVEPVRYIYNHPYITVADYRMRC